MKKLEKKKSDLCMSDVLFMWFSDSKTYKGILHFWKKKKKLRTKEVFMRHIILRCFGKLLIYATRDLGLEEKSITSYPH